MKTFTSNISPFSPILHCNKVLLDLCIICATRFVGRIAAMLKYERILIETALKNLPNSLFSLQIRSKNFNTEVCS
jgi:hypothetical protein